MSHEDCVFIASQIPVLAVLVEGRQLLVGMLFSRQPTTHDMSDIRSDRARSKRPSARRAAGDARRAVINEVPCERGRRVSRAMENCPPRRHEELPPPRIAEESEDERGTNRWKPVVD